MTEKKAAESADRRTGDRRKEPGGKLPPDKERRKSGRRADDGEPGGA